MKTTIRLFALFALFVANAWAQQGTVLVDLTPLSPTYGKLLRPTADEFYAKNPPGSGGSGTVTIFSSGDLSPLFTTSVANPTSTPSLTFSLTSAAQNYVFAGPASGGTGAPSYRALVATDIPTLNQSTTGSAATLTATRSIYGHNFNGSADLTQVIASTFGGTGVNNSGRTITVAGNFATAGANALTLTTTGSTNVTLPTSGTLLAGPTLSGINSITAATGQSLTLATLDSNANIVLDPHGTGKTVLAAGSSLAWEDSAGVLGPILYRDSDGAIHGNREIRLEGSLALFGKLGASSTENVMATDVTGDTNNRFIVQVSGAMYWGPGSGATDVVFLRSGVSQMQLGGGLAVTGNLSAANLATGFISGTVADGNMAVLIAGESKGFRIIPNAAGTLFEGVNNAGNLYDLLTIGGSSLEFAIQGTTKLTLNAAGNLVGSGSITTAAPSGGTAAAWKFGTVATVSPTAQNRTIELEVGGTTYYLTAKTTNN